MLLHLPLALTAIRALLAPVLVLLAMAWPDRLLLGIVLVTGFLSDVFDGVMARRLGVATATLRRLDSLADSVFYVCAMFAAWHLHEGQVRDYLIPLGVLLVVELSRYAFDYAKFRREASYHMWSSKVWGLALFAGFFCLLALGRGGWPVALAIYLGIVADLEGFAISMTLKQWQTDVPSLYHAIQLRRAEV
ncbi:CDP-alcohol phosphatidyltransferase family protein [Rhodanobacter sp. AS-Z3]|uniref:CDP-alcohol phosphatidyltransferase family protein n=1 Tax=Rhodanobacter sp. AS-Z3 TaxID=3031330 RepID=UPI00247AC9C5|nr:CDP-alcohol phosphatidyltransferase family protein [Rhodanobacter sp. AS-Z3]WEN15453.1 CDP-alcohol phosphatidyltransferase family protein [Rhodanobacter sp. AS-Z3]